MPDPDLAVSSQSTPDRHVERHLAHAVEHVEESPEVTLP